MRAQSNLSTIIENLQKDYDKKILPKTNVESFGLDEDSLKKLVILHTIQPNANGQFIDYLIRVYLSNAKGEVFTDERTEHIIKTYERFKFPFPNDLDINAAYNRVRNEKSEKPSDVLIISMAHTISFSQIIGEKTNELLETIKTFETKTELFEHFKSVILRLFKADECDLNPVLGYGTETWLCAADADIIENDCIIELNCSKYDSDTKYKLLQTCCYAALAKKHNKLVSKAMIVNPIINKIYRFSLSESDLDKYFSVIEDYFKS